MDIAWSERLAAYNNDWLNRASQRRQGQKQRQNSGWDHLLGLNFGHYWVGFQGDDYYWPYTAVWNKPNTWVTTALGDQPAITALAPFTATVLAPSLAMTVTGSGFVSGTVALWSGVAVPTTVVDGEHLLVQVGAAQLNTAAVVPVTAQSPAPANFASNSVPFVVEVATLVISTLTPNQVVAGSPTLPLTIDGSGFAANAQVLWNGTVLTPQSVNPTQIKVTIEAALLANGEAVGVAVRNPLPSEHISSAAGFAVQPKTTDTNVLYLPLVAR